MIRATVRLEMGGVFDGARSIINWLEGQWEGFVLSRDPEFTASLHEADEDLVAGHTVPLDELRSELDAEDRPLAY